MNSLLHANTIQHKVSCCVGARARAERVFFRLQRALGDEVS